MTRIVDQMYLPSFGMTGPDQTTVCIYTVLSINDRVGDCAAYHGVGPQMYAADPAYDGLIERVRAGGDKIRAADAIAMFPEITERKLRYRP